MSDDLRLSEYRPRPMLRVAEHRIERPRFPVIDMHNHSQWGGPWQVSDVPALVDELDAAGVAAMVDLDGGNGERLREHLARFRQPYPDRFVVFTTCDWDRHLGFPDVGERLAEDLRRVATAGAEGLKIWKDVGLTRRDGNGRLVRLDDERLSPLFATAGELGLPVLIHTADPMAFFEPLDAANERYEELVRHPDWHFYGADFPPFDALLDQFEAMVSQHPGTRFIGAHVASLAEDLDRVGRMLDRCPNLTVDIAARTAELGRQPYTARRFLTDYAGRVVFGLDDWPAKAREYRVVYRLLETQDEYFPYTGDPEAAPGAQGRWRIYGLGLSEEPLRQLYYGAALALVPRLAPVVDARQTGR